jgi:hypothetical protein
VRLDAAVPSLPFPLSWPQGAALSPSPADRCRVCWVDDPAASAREIALRARCSLAQASRVRDQLASLGVLPASRWPRPAFPAFRPVGQAPRELMIGSCVGHRAGPDLWASPSAPAERELAKAVCSGCPVMLPCREWSLGLPQSDRGIYGGWGAPDRERELLRRRGQPVPLRLTAKGKNAARTRRRAAREEAAS